MRFGRMRVAQNHLNTRMTEHRRERDQVDRGHSSASRPGMTKIVESKMWDRTLVCFRSDPVDSCQRADVRTIYFDDWLVGRTTGKNRIVSIPIRRLQSSQSWGSALFGDSLRASAMPRFFLCGKVFKLLLTAESAEVFAEERREKLK